MNNKELKPTANTVGVAPLGDPHFEEYTKKRNYSKTCSTPNSKPQTLTSNVAITLIALVITIIVMLILVGVSVSIAINGGLFGVAKDATRQTQIAQIRELIQQDILEVQIQNGGSITREQLKEILEEYFTNVPEKLPEDLAEVTLTAKEKYGGYDNIPLTDIYNGKIEDKVDVALTAKNIAENSSEYFGKEVRGYECPSDGVDSWMIFYADDNNVYLIASDFIACNDYPRRKKWNENYGRV